ncbi:MAG TPA: ABC transporter permease [Vicinamibacteria bacterium]|nr:ABC transporter permease [Vicinamibacteria bacterium]
MSWTRFFRRRRWDEERARELESYLEMETDENVARGLPPDEARQAARRKLGEPLRIREEIYLMNTVGIVDVLWQDLRYGARVLRLNPGFAAVAVLSLALGVGANSAIFQLLNAVRIRTLPVKDPSELVEVRIADRKAATGRFTGRYPQLTNPLWEGIRDKAEGFSGLTAWSTSRFDLSDGGEARYAEGLWVSGAFFETLGVRPAAGRLLTPEEDVRGCASPGVVISHAFWQRELGGDPSAVGRSLRLDGHPFPILGVTGAGFFGVEVGRSFDVAVPLCAEPTVDGANAALDKSDWWFLAAIGRIKPGWTVARATAQLAQISPGILQATVSPRYSVGDAKTYLAYTLAAFPAGTGVSTLRRNYEKPLWILLAMTALVLLIACANLANLMLARASAREREIAVRLAIGASRGRIVRQLMAESLLVAAFGAGAGALLARWLSASLVAFLSTEGNRLFVDLETDWRVLAFTSGLAVLTCVLFGLAPAVRATHVAPAAAMKSGGRGVTSSRERFGLRRGLVVAQMALSLVLVVGALLFVGTLRNLLTVDPGFRADDVLWASLDMRRAGFPDAQEIAIKKGIVESLGRLPGVVAAAQADILPVSGSGWNQTILVGGEVQKDYPNFNRVSPGYFKAMGTPLVAGRDFDERDTASSEAVAIVNETFARKYLGGRDPFRQAFQIEEPPGAPRPRYQVVGVVKDTKYYNLREPFTPIAYLAAAQETQPDAFLQVVIRTAANPAALVPAVTRSVAEVHPLIGLKFDSMKSQVRRTLQSEALMATLTGSFGILAGVIAAVGLYGVMSYLVARRRNEIGIRMALGADRRAVVKMVLRESGLLLGAGVVVGAVLAVGAARAASALLFGLSPGDPLTFVKAVASLAAVAALASYLPAERAARVDPTLALRDE